MNDLRNWNLESLFDVLYHLLISLGTNERNRDTLGSETTGTTNTMEVRVSVSWEIIIDGQVDTLDIDSAPKNVGGDTNTLVELFELLVALDTSFPLDSIRRTIMGVHYRSS